MLVSVLHHYINSMMKISNHLIRYAVMTKRIKIEWYAQRNTWWIFITAGNFDRKGRKIPKSIRRINSERNILLNRKLYPSDDCKLYYPI